jgi:hypothetical protein
MKDVFTVNERPIQLTSLRSIFARSRTNGETAVELLLATGKLLLLDFHPIDNAKILKLFEKAPVKTITKVSEDTLAESWLKGYRSNFYYLMKLNIYSGRTFNDLILFPLLPSVKGNFAVNDRKVELVTVDCYLIENDFEGAYLRRKTLESDSVTAQLPTFIDNFFGRSASLDFGHRRLFDRQHPLRVESNRLELAQDLEKHIVRGAVLAFAAVLSTRPEFFRLGLITEHGESIRATIGIGTTIDISAEIVTKLPAWERPVFASFEEDIAIFDRKRMALNYLHNCEGCIQGVLWAETDFVWCLGGGDVLYCPTATTVAVRSADGARNKELCFTLSPIQCLAANPLFRTFVVATLDGTVSAHSLVNGRHVVQNQLSGIVGLVLTLRICLVVVFREANVSVLNVSGEMMKTVEFSRRIVTAFAVSSAGDIDFVVVQTDGLQLGQDRGIL